MAPSGDESGSKDASDPSLEDLLPGDSPDASKDEPTDILEALDGNWREETLSGPDHDHSD